MAIDYPRYEREIETTIGQIRAAMDEIGTELQKGFVLSILPTEELDWDYLSAQLFFNRIWDEIEKSLLLLREFDKDKMQGKGIDSQLYLDELAQRQRKLFECLLAIKLLTKSEILDSKDYQLYFQHFHLVQDYDYFRLRNADFKEFFDGKPCDYVDKKLKHLEGKIDALEKRIDKSHCTWASGYRTRNAKEQLMKVNPSAANIEKAALGYGYQEVFGAASSQIHLNMSGYHDPVADEGRLLKSADNVLLSVICIVLNSGIVFEKMGNKPGAALLDLRKEFLDKFPDSYLSAATGSADKNDIVVVFEKPNTFVAKVVDKDNTGDYATFEVEPLHNIGRWGKFADSEVMLCLREGQLKEFEGEAKDLGLIKEDETFSCPYEAVAKILRNQKAYEKLVKEQMNKNLLPSLFFVQRYQERASTVK